MSSIDFDRLTIFDRDRVPIPHSFVFQTWRYPRALKVRECDYLKDGDEVLAVSVDEGVRAYPVRAVQSHHVVQDRIGQREVLITF